MVIVSVRTGGTGLLQKTLKECSWCPGKHVSRASRAPGSEPEGWLPDRAHGGLADVDPDNPWARMCGRRAIGGPGRCTSQAAPTKRARCAPMTLESAGKPARCGRVRWSSALAQDAAMLPDLRLRGRCDALMKQGGASTVLSVPCSNGPVGTKRQAMPTSQHSITTQISSSLLRVHLSRRLRSERCKVD